MAFPADGPATLALVKEHLEIDDTVDDTAIERIVDAVNSRVLLWPVAQGADGAGSWEGYEHVTQGAVMLAARLFRRRKSPDGVSAFADAGPIYVQRNDPDIALLLGLGAHAKPAVG